MLAGLLALAAPATAAAETLVLTCEKCTELIVTGKRLPESRRRGPWLVLLLQVLTLCDQPVGQLVEACR